VKKCQKTVGCGGIFLTHTVDDIIIFFPAGQLKPIAHAVNRTANLPENDYKTVRKWAALYFTSPLKTRKSQMLVLTFTAAAESSTKSCNSHVQLCNNQFSKSLSLHNELDSHRRAQKSRYLLCHWHVKNQLSFFVSRLLILQCCMAVAEIVTHFRPATEMMYKEEQIFFVPLTSLKTGYHFCQSCTSITHCMV